MLAKFLSNRWYSRETNKTWSYRGCLFLSCCALFLTLSVSPAFAVPHAELAGEKDFGFQKADRGFTALPTDDGGYVVAGETLSYYMHGSGGYDGFLVKIDDKGYIKWQRNYGKGNDERIVAVQPTKDGGFIMTGYSHSAPWRSDKNIFLVKTTAEGVEEWSKIIGEKGDESGSYVLPTSDGGYIICGETNSAGAGDKDLYVLKTTDSGKIQWERTFGGKCAETGSVLLEIPGGGYLVAGQTNSFGAGNYDIYLLRLNDKGEKVWEKTFGGSDLEEVTSVQLTKDNAFLLAGRTFSYSQSNSDAYLLKVDAAGKEIWKRNYPLGNSSLVKSIAPTADGHYWLAGWVAVKGQQGYDFWLAKVDSNGKKVWEKRLAHSKFVDESFAIQPTDTGYLVTGWWTDFMKWDSNKSDDVNVFTVRVEVN